MNKNVFFITGGIAVFLISFGLFLFVRKSVVGFDIGGFSDKNCVPYNVFIEKGGNDFAVNIRWSTKAKCFGFVQYGKDPNAMDMIAVDLENNSKSKEHSVSIEKLLTKDRYYFLINSEEQAYGNSGIPLEFVLENL